MNSKAISRNTLCPCGSTKKYKHCCQQYDDQQRSATLTQERNSSKILQLALQHFRVGHLIQAEALYQQLPEHPEALFMLGKIAYDSAHFSNAITYLNKAIALKPESQLLCNLGLAYEALNDIPAALDSYQKALMLNPRDADAFYSLGCAYQSQQQWEEAVKHFQAALTLEPNASKIHYALGCVLVTLEKFELAKTCYEHAIALQRDFADAYNNLGLLMHIQQQFDNAVNYYRQALKFKPNSAIALNNLGNTLLIQEQPNLAIDQYRRAIACHPTYAEAHHNLGAAMYQLGETEAAAESFRQALTLKPDYLNAWMSLGKFGLEKNDFNLAAECFTQATILKPDCTDAYSSLGLTSLKQGKADATVAYFRSAITLQLQTSFSAPGPKKPPMQLDLAREALISARNLLMAAEIPFFLCSGTLLGIVRNNDILPYDKDMDLGIPWHVDRELISRILTQSGIFEEGKVQEDTFENRQWHLSFVHIKNQIALDLFFYCPDDEHFICGFNFLPFPVQSHPHRFEIGTLFWQGLDWPIPEPVEQYLTDFYGSDWRIPDPYFDTVVASHCQLPSSWPSRRNFGYARLFDRIKEQEWLKAEGYCRQMLRLQDDSFLTDLLASINTHIEKHA